MRKSVKLATASTFAAVAMLGATATAASAHGYGHDHDRDVNVCGNGGGYPVALTDDGTSTVTVTGASSQVICQNGRYNSAVITHDGDVAGEGIVSTIAEALGEGSVASIGLL